MCIHTQLHLNLRIFCFFSLGKASKNKIDSCRVLLRLFHFLCRLFEKLVCFRDSCQRALVCFGGIVRVLLRFYSCVQLITHIYMLDNFCF